MNRNTRILPTTASEIAAGVTKQEYNRLLSLPRNHQLEGDLLERAIGARTWYEKFGNPFIASCKIDIRSVEAENILLTNSVELRSVVLANRLRTGSAHALVVVAASAGQEVATRVSELWSEGKPDEAFFLDRFAVGITERLLFWGSAYLCRESESTGETLMAHLSPGCGNWDIADQHRLMSLLTEENKVGPIRLLETGALEPQHSILAALGVSRQNFAATPKDLCRCCNLNPCSFRRAPYEDKPLETSGII